MTRSPLQNLSTLFFAACGLLLSARAGAQHLEATLQTYAENYAPERVHLHYDKPAYAPGETVWFKAYLLEGLTPAEKSKSFYVDWLDDKGTVLLHSVCPIVEGTTNGQFDVPENYKGKYLQVRAYTKWMLNFDTAFIYNKNLRILGEGSAAAAKPAIVPSLQFFAEGGDVVAGIVNRIAFKVTDQWGTPVPVSGVVQNSSGAAVDSFRTTHNGMGILYLQPQTGETYTAKWKDSKGTVHTTPLPAAKGEGISLQLLTQGKRRQFTINRTAGAPEVLRRLHLVGTMHQQMVFRADIDLSTQAIKKGIIPTENLPSGVVTITLFDDTWRPVAERITFVNNEDYSFTANMEVQHWGLNKRARNEIQITVPDSIAANLSVAITDASITADSSSNIVSQLLLSSELRGYIHQPAHYFKNNHDSTAQQLDLVMLTNGWRRLKWDAIVSGKLPQLPFARDTAYLTLSGKVYGFTPQQLAGANGTIVMFIKQKDTTAQMVMSPIDSKGMFSEPEFIFFDSLSVYYTLQPSKTLKGGDVRFMEDRMAPPDHKKFSKYFTPYNPLYDTTGSYQQYRLAMEKLKVNDLMKEKMMENVTVRAKTKTPLETLDEKYASGLFSSDNGYQFDLVNDPAASSYMSIFQYLMGKVAGLQINTAGADVSMQWRGGTPQLYLDEMPTDANMISSVPVSDIAYVKVLRPPFMGAPGGGAGGAIAIYTRRGDDVTRTPGKGLNTFTINGYTAVREFYSPNYSSFDRRNEERDLRTTLYWNPMVITSRNKKTVTLNFYNNDVSKAFRVIIEGMTRDGRLVHVEQLME